MIKRLGLVLTIIGIVLLAYTGYMAFDFYKGSQLALDEAKALMREAPARELIFPDGEGEAMASPSGSQLPAISDQLAFEEGDIIGILRVPSIDLEIPIAHGVEKSSLRKGVGHERSTGLPGENKQIFLAGHNDSAFLKMGDIKEGDEITVEMAYGTFSYVMTDSKLVDKDAKGIIGKEDTETLVLMTCFPFHSWFDPPERYLIYATPS